MKTPTPVGAKDPDVVLALLAMHSGREYSFSEEVKRVIIETTSGNPGAYFDKRSGELAISIGYRDKLGDDAVDLQAILNLLNQHGFLIGE